MKPRLTYKTNLIAGVFLALLACILVSCERSVETQDSTLKVGAILPLSGNFAIIGSAIRDGMLLAVEEFKHSSTIQVIFEDDQSFRSSAAANAASKLLNVDKVSVILNSVIGTAHPIAFLASAKKVPVLIIWDSSDVIEELGEYVFGLGFKTELVGKEMASFGFSELNLKKFGVVSAANEWSEVVAKAFSEEIKQLGGEIVLHERVSAEESDFKATILKIKSIGARAVFFPLFSRSLVNFVKQFRELAADAVLLTPDGFTEHDLKILGPNAEGIFVMQPWLDSENFRKKVEAKFYKTVSPSLLAFMGLGYDSIKLLSDLLKASRAKAFNAYNEEFFSQEIKKGLPGFAFEGAFGRVEILPSRKTSRKMSILKVEGGKFKLVKSF